jgi:hypothetical protein
MSQQVRRRTIAWQVSLLLIAVLIPTVWFFPWSATPDYWRVADDGALAFGFRVSADQLGMEGYDWTSEGNTLTIRFSALRPWFAGEAELLLSDSHMRTPAVVIDGSSGREVPRR